MLNVASSPALAYAVVPVQPATAPDAETLLPLQPTLLLLDMARSLVSGLQI